MNTRDGLLRRRADATMDEDGHCTVCGLLVREPEVYVSDAQAMLHHTCPPGFRTRDSHPESALLQAMEDKGIPLTKPRTRKMLCCVKCKVPRPDQSDDEAWSCCPKCGRIVTRNAGNAKWMDFTDEVPMNRTERLAKAEGWLGATAEHKLAWAQAAIMHLDEALSLPALIVQVLMLSAKVRERIAAQAIQETTP